MNKTPVLLFFYDVLGGDIRKGYAGVRELVLL